MNTGDFIDVVLQAEGGQPPYEWQGELPVGLGCRRWGAVCGIVPVIEAGQTAKIVLRDSKGNRTSRQVPLVVDAILRGPEGYIHVPGGYCLVGYHPTPARDGWLNSLGQSGLTVGANAVPMSAKLARENWPAGRLHLDGYFIQQSPVTNREYDEFVRTTQSTSPWTAGSAPPDKLNHPVVNVSYTDAVAYCEWKTEQSKQQNLLWTYALPTHWEWEKAAKGGAAGTAGEEATQDGPCRIYPWGDTWIDGNCHDLHTPSDGPVDVAAHTGVASPAGVSDLAGNVAEWVDGGKVEEGHRYRSLRGGSWRRNAKFYGLSFFTGDELRPEGMLDDDVGFRCVIRHGGNRRPEQAMIRLGGDTFVNGQGQRLMIGEFWLGRFAVTNEEYAECQPSHAFCPDERWRPVTDISYQDALRFCNWKNARDGERDQLVYRLPSRTEWERACRGVDGRVYPWGPTFSRYCCNSRESGFGHPVDVDAFWEGATPDGIYGLCGNVSQWLSTQQAIGGSYCCACISFGKPPYPFDDTSANGEGQLDIGFRLAAHRRP